MAVQPGCDMSHVHESVISKEVVQCMDQLIMDIDMTKMNVHQTGSRGQPVAAATQSHCGWLAGKGFGTSRLRSRLLKPSHNI